MYLTSTIFLPLSRTVDVIPGTMGEWQYLQIVRLIEGSLLTKRSLSALNSWQTKLI